LKTSSIWSPRVIEVGRSSFVVGHDFVDATGIFARGECRHVWIRTHPQHTAVEVPDWLRQAVVPRETALEVSANRY
jgi:acyl-CoA thioesterase FadM